MDRRIKFRHLDAFSSIARAGSLKRAADALHLSQPADLQDAQGTGGYRRRHLDGAGPLGCDAHPGGERSFFSSQSNARPPCGTGCAVSGPAARRAARISRSGVLPSVASGLLPEAAAGFARNNPDTLLEIHEGPHQDLTARLRAGRLDSGGRAARAAGKHAGASSSGSSIPKEVVVPSRHRKPGGHGPAPGGARCVPGCFIPPADSAIRPAWFRADADRAGGVAAVPKNPDSKRLRGVRAIPGGRRSGNRLDHQPRRAWPRACGRGGWSGWTSTPARPSARWG